MYLLESNRIIIQKFKIEDASFIYTILNSPGWLKYIGDRKIKTIEDARVYLQSGPFAHDEKSLIGLRAIFSKKEGELVGLCGLLQRDYLDAPDLGFAILPKYYRMGYAEESCRCIIEWCKDQLETNMINAITRSDNEASQGLLKKLDFYKIQEMPRDDELLILYRRNL